MMNTNTATANEGILHIEDAHGRKLFYQFTPAAVISNFVPLIVLLHDEGESESAPHFEYRMWNVLTPLDSFGYENRGSYWLGEKGDFFLKDLLQSLIRQIAEEYECEEHIYLYGKGMGGYGAILHGILCGANTVYAHAPQIRVAKDSDTQREAFYAAVFGESLGKERDLANFLNPADTFPLFYLCDGSDAVLGKERAYFETECQRHAIACRLDYSFKSEEGGCGDIKAVLDFLARVASEA